MRRTTVFMSGNSQAVRLPKDFQLADREVQIYRRGDEIVVRPIPKSIGEGLQIIPPCPEDLSAEPREDRLPQKRDWE